MIKNRLKQAREAAGMTQTELADAANTSQTSIYKIENGITLRPRGIERIATVLHVSPEWLQFGVADADADNEMSNNESKLIQSFRHISSTQQKSIADILRGMVTELSKNERELLEKFEKLNNISQGFLLRMADTLVEQQEELEETKLVEKIS